MVALFLLIEVWTLDWTGILTRTRSLTDLGAGGGGGSFRCNGEDLNGVKKWYPDLEIGSRRSYFLTRPLCVE
jgi:hypothetical protein